MTDFVLTLIGPDRPGLVDAVASIVAGHGGNWLESRMVHLGGQFAGILRAEIPDARADGVVAALSGLKSQGITVVATTESRVEGVASDGLSMDLELVGLDRPGLVRELSKLLAASGINVEELLTDRRSAPMSGETLFEAHAQIRVPSSTDVTRLHADLEHAARDLMVDLRLADRPSKAKDAK